MTYLLRFPTDPRVLLLPCLFRTCNHVQRGALERLTAPGRLPTRVLKRTRALLLLDQDYTLASVTKLLSASDQNIGNWHDRFEEDALPEIFDKPRSGFPIEIDSSAHASVMALACSEPPEGRSRWTLRLLADKAVELQYCEHHPHNHIATILKNEFKPYLKRQWCTGTIIPRLIP